MAVSTATRTTEVTIAEAKARFSELVRRVEISGETIIITRRGKPVAQLSPAVAEMRPGNIATDLHGLLADHPEVCDEIEKACAERRQGTASCPVCLLDGQQTRATRASVAEAKARLSEMVREVDIGGETITVTRRGRPVAALRPTGQRNQQAGSRHWVYDLAGMFADDPELCEEIDKVYAERSLHMPREIEM